MDKTYINQQPQSRIIEGAQHTGHYDQKFGSMFGQAAAQLQGSEIQREFEDLMRTLARLENSLGELRGRLAPVLDQYPPAETMKNPSEVESEPRSEIGAKIRSAKHEVSAHERNVRDLIDRIML